MIADLEYNKPHKWNTAYNATPRLMENGHWAVPFSACFVMKKIKDFKPDECSMDVVMTLILRIRFSGMQNMEQVMDWVIENLKCRVNEEEGPIYGDGGRSGKHDRTESSTCKKED